MSHTPGAEGFAALIYAEDTLTAVVVPEEPFVSGDAARAFVAAEGGLADDYDMKIGAIVTDETLTDALTEALHDTPQGPDYTERLTAALIALTGLEAS